MNVASAVPRRSPPLWHALSGAFLACLAACAASGMVLLVQYRPMGDVFHNVEEITTLIPYGFFFRRLHYYSGQACVLLALAHLAHHVWRGAWMRMAAVDRLRLIAGLGICFAMLLTGFMLKGDQEARFAATVCKGLAASVPLVGGAASGMVSGQGDTLLFPSYLWHCFALPPCLFLLLRGHVKHWLPDAGLLAAIGLGLAALCLAAPLPLPVLPDAHDLAVTGPWFMLGMQEMLRHAPPLAAGVAAPLAYAALLGGLPALKGRMAVVAKGLLLAGAGGYVLLSVRLLLS